MSYVIVGPKKALIFYFESLQFFNQIRMTLTVKLSQKTFKMKDFLFHPQKLTGFARKGNKSHHKKQSCSSLVEQKRANERKTNIDAGRIQTHGNTDIDLLQKYIYYCGRGREKRPLWDKNVGRVKQFRLLCENFEGSSATACSQVYRSCAGNNPFTYPHEHIDRALRKLLLTYAAKILFLASIIEKYLSRRVDNDEQRFMFSK